jgi:hypothetical protein
MPAAVDRWRLFPQRHPDTLTRLFTSEIGNQNHIRALPQLQYAQLAP